MNKSGNSRYYAAWVAHPDGMDVLAGWLKGLTAKESEPWRATAVVLLEVIKKMEVTKEILLDKKKKFTIARMLGKVVNNAALSESEWVSFVRGETRRDWIADSLGSSSSF